VTESLGYYDFNLYMIASLGRNDYLAKTSSDQNDALFTRMHICFQHHVIVLNAILC
jgi:hypothetical protein